MYFTSVWRQIFGRERLNGHYGVGVFTVSNFLASFPFLAVMSLGSATITYNMVGFQPGFTHFLYAFLDLFMAIAVVESCMMIVASLVPNFLTGIIAGAGLIVRPYFSFVHDIKSGIHGYISL